MIFGVSSNCTLAIRGRGRAGGIRAWILRGRLWLVTHYSKSMRSYSLTHTLNVIAHVTSGHLSQLQLPAWGVCAPEVMGLWARPCQHSCHQRLQSHLAAAT